MSACLHFSNTTLCDRFKGAFQLISHGKLSLTIWEGQKRCKEVGSEGSSVGLQLMSILAITRIHNSKDNSSKKNLEGIFMYGERQICFRSCLNCAMNYTYGVCQFKGPISKLIKSQFVIKVTDYENK